MGIVKSVTCVYNIHVEVINNEKKFKELIKRVCIKLKAMKYTMSISELIKLEHLIDDAISDNNFIVTDKKIKNIMFLIGDDEKLIYRKLFKYYDKLKNSIKKYYVINT